MEDSKIIQLYWDRDESAIPATSEKYGAYCTAIARNILKNEGFYIGIIALKELPQREILTWYIVIQILSLDCQEHLVPLNARNINSAIQIVEMCLNKLLRCFLRCNPEETIFCIEHLLESALYMITERALEHLLLR